MEVPNTSLASAIIGILQTGKFCQEVLTGLQIAMILVLLMAFEATNRGSSLVDATVAIASGVSKMRGGIRYHNRGSDTVQVRVM
jgi:mannose/fructose-specific phosphotransferase system component IIA